MPPKARGSGFSRFTPIRLVSFSAALSALCACPAWAARWDVVPTVTVRETYTDNVTLTQDALKQSEWVTQLIPGIAVAATGARLRFDASYAPEITYYARGTDDNQVFNRGTALGVAELAEKLLFIEAGGRVDQYDVAPGAPISINNVYNTGNRATVASYYGSPYLRHAFGAAVRGELRYTYSVVNTDDNPALSNSVSDRINLRLNSGPAFSLLTWDFAYTGESIRYDTQDDTDIQLVSANARRLITPTFGLLAQAGYDYYRTGNIIPASEGPYWAAGFDWTPSPVTRLAATAGQRFYGNEYFFDYRHRTRLTAWNAGYSQTITTARNQFFVPATGSTAGYLDTLYTARFPDPAARQKVVNDFITRTGLPPSLNSPINFFTNQLFLAKRWHASMSLQGVSHLVIANVFHETREGVAGDLVLPDAPNATKQTGTSLVWNWRMTPQTSWNLGGAYSRIETPITGQVDNVSFVGLGITRQFQRRVSGSLAYRRQQTNSNISAASFTENAGIASLEARF